MSHVSPWQLPAGISSALPAQAQSLEFLRRNFLDLYHNWGYELVMPPFIEYLDALLTGTGADLERNTFKLTDQLSGRLMGVRADMTPQVARMEAHQLQRDVPTRLCYIGTVLRTHPKGLSRSRSLLQAGAELFGHAGVASDIEILQLMQASLQTISLPRIHIDIGHVAIYRNLVKQAELNPEQAKQLFDIVQRKDTTELHQSLSQWQIKADVAHWLIELFNLNGDASMLEHARQVFMYADNEIKQALEELQQIATVVNHPALQFDLAELRGYSYHTGFMFSVYVEGYGDAIAAGGRYDDIGKKFGRARPAVGFSTDLRLLDSLRLDKPPATDNKILAPDSNIPDLLKKVAELRAQGHCVIRALNKSTADEMDCQSQLERDQRGQWQVVNNS